MCSKHICTYLSKLQNVFSEIPNCQMHLLKINLSKLQNVCCTTLITIIPQKTGLLQSLFWVFGIVAQIWNFNWTFSILDYQCPRRLAGATREKILLGIFAARQLQTSCCHLKEALWRKRLSSCKTPPFSQKQFCVAVSTALQKVQCK